jgi:MFS family permease
MIGERSFAMRNFWNVARQFDRNILRFLLVWSMIGFAYFGIIGVVLNLYLVRLGYGPEFIGRLHASGQLTWAIFALPAGLIGRKWGIKQAIIAATVVNAVGTIVMIAAESLPADLLSAGLTAGWLLTWIGAALITVNGAPYLMAVITPENRGYGFSAQQAAMGAATFRWQPAGRRLPWMDRGTVRPFAGTGSPVSLYPDAGARGLPGGCAGLYPGGCGAGP